MMVFPTAWRKGPRGGWWAALACVVAAITSAAPQGHDAATLLRRAELVRNPFLGTAIDIESTVISRETGRILREARYTMLTHQKDRTLLLMWPRGPGTPATLLLADDTYWLLLPQAARPVPLAFRFLVAGDLSHAGFLRVNLRVRYEPRLDGEDILQGVPCQRLILFPKSDPAPFGSVHYWVAGDDFRPLRIDFYAGHGSLVKTARFIRYQESGSGPRPAVIEIEDALRPNERTLLHLGKPEGIATAKLEFDLDDLAALRDVARAGQHRAEIMTGKQLVEALIARTDISNPVPAEENGH